MELLDPWTDDDDRALSCCATMANIGKIAVATSARLRKMANGHKVHQLCGPMSTGGFGSLESNMRVFQAAIVIARKKGLVVFDQMPLQSAMVRIINGRKQKGYAQDILDEVYRPLFVSGNIDRAKFLPTWKTSTGTTWERETIPKISKIEILEYPKDWFHEALNLSRVIMVFSE